MALVYAFFIASSTGTSGGGPRAGVFDPAAVLASAFGSTATADATTERILDAASQQFSTVGIKRTSMEEVARNAGVSRMTVYRHVANKDDLVEQVLGREFRRYVTDYLASQDPASTPVDRIVGGYLTTLRALRHNPMLQTVLGTELDALVSSMADSAGPVLNLARTFMAMQLRNEQADGAIDGSVDLDVVADVMVRLAVSFVLIPSEVVDLDDDAQADALVRATLLPMLGWSDQS